MGWSLRWRCAVAAVAVAGCSVFPDSPPVVGHLGVEGGAGGTGGVSDASSGGRSGGAAGATVEAGRGGSDAGGDAGVLEHAYAAAVADCLEQVAATKTPNPDACIAFASGKDGPNELWVDLRKGTHRQFNAFLRFELDAQLASRTLLGARVEVTVTSFASAVGNAPELWECAPFSRASLFVQEPALIGSSALAPAPGLLSMSQTVSYPVPMAALVVSPSVYFALVPVVAGGTGFWNSFGPEPPRLVVTYR